MSLQIKVITVLIWDTKKCREIKEINIVKIVSIIIHISCNIILAKSVNPSSNILNFTYIPYTILAILNVGKKGFGVNV